jgi:hypothetical protein
MCIEFALSILLRYKKLPDVIIMTHHGVILLSYITGRLTVSIE